MHVHRALLPSIDMGSQAIRKKSINNFPPYRNVKTVTNGYV
ncbi:hypothetical protein BURPS1106B_2894 [Burkholderia pseudomallei 1106b]|uniref:Uncharacterized protein n=2 Tax=Burkholderia pseudomallei TaxID=28450 RepID=A0A0E1VQN6_BURPE|nr:hypothetical protein BURPS668_A2425 [Burkholderia pseudomallei 668]ABN93223.1 hypothetical protein BURPS1106A_A2286 [Burkholderia pseudomallei 1106a]EBA50491.1 hypothetical protein BURPS305_5773 [Burkholderia pseudomallei 305]EEC34856.1 conserved hypothetical protein [Burkholderia pseudomallei 576]EEP49027.1 conserved hypothetical protein [Burkholderia pseudomallei MSHR346]EES22981.1 hypothetical protein BURPS1106B_2894 [Burkholderia pseudomallei 1106b]EET03148.1 hypothetical protein BURPS